MKIFIATFIMIFLVGCGGKIKPHPRNLECFNMAMNEIKKEGRPYPPLSKYGNALTVRPFWVGKYKFVFTEDEEPFFIMVQEGSGYVYAGEKDIAFPGSDVSKRIPLDVLKEKYPDRFKRTLAEKAAYLVIQVRCEPKITIDPQWILQTPKEREESEGYRVKMTSAPITYPELGLIGYPDYTNEKENNILWQSYYAVNNFRAIDGRPFRVICAEVGGCQGTFVLKDGLVIDYAYPIEYVADWQDFYFFVLEYIVQHLQFS
ncbi:hypothetical protein NT239_16150 [Chitinibacter sp. SCUT-21]|uniref:hypothetical protein n=1 Tax=Chitinibacter sp. SCUT-21 TaxID=2970891 RepID=UPI0035A5D8E8